MVIDALGSGRGIGEVAALQDQLPESAAIVLAFLTQLGDIWFLATLLTILYWTGWPARSDVATLAGAWLAGMGVYKGLKEVVGSPRPNEPLLDPELVVRPLRPIYEATAFASGYGFPSGHAVNATIVFVGLAAVLPIGSMRQRSLGAGGLVAVVSFTRIALGLHYLVDVMAGIVLGGVVLLSVSLLGRVSIADRGTIGFGVSIAAGLFYASTAPFELEAIVLLGSALGAFGGWQVVLLARDGTRLTEVTPDYALASTAICLVLLAIVAFPSYPAYSMGGITGLVVAGIIALPTGNPPTIRHALVDR